MATVVPTVLAATPEEYQTMLARAESLSQRVHIDICDGAFADNQTIGLAQIQVEEGVEIDLHLMLQDPATQLENALSLKPRVIIFHAEASGDIAGCMAHTQELRIKAGVAILPETSVESARGLIEKADHVLVFTGTLGHNGGEFKSDQLPKVAEIRAIKPAVEISVDGGITDLNAALVVLEDADILYVGGFVQMAPDPEAAYASVVRQAEVQS